VYFKSQGFDLNIEVLAFWFKETSIPNHSERSSSKRITHNDPVKYDFALFGLGVFEGF
jgi:hypothetical protein